MADIKDHSSRLKNSYTNDDIESEAIKVEVGDNFVVIANRWRMETLFLLFCVIRHCTIVRQCLKIVGGTNGMRATCF
jgi:hypothetical protein